jgi:hypothetical protein
VKKEKEKEDMFEDVPQRKDRLLHSVLEEDLVISDNRGEGEGKKIKDVMGFSFSIVRTHHLRMKLFVVFLFAFITFVRSIEICECNTCPGSCEIYPLDNCTQELDLCTGSPISGSYIRIIDNFPPQYRIRFYEDDQCLSQLDNAAHDCNVCNSYPDEYPTIGFQGIVQCPGGGGGGECSANVVVYEDDECGTVGLCDDRDNLRSGECQTLTIDDETFYAYVNCTANSTTVYSGEDCTGTPRTSDDTNCASMGDYSVQVFFSNECPSDGDGDGSSQLESSLINDVASTLFSWAFSAF